ncbi:response regulator [Methanoregula sp.]|uniref:response regulator n=1 Tax=Methanoregula sp. TaxID=2052170 RepID=UPI002370CFAE|nr:response regulator [Methanoregula sp.]MDD1685884.1 response regulator [Methanoregula sp.]
MTATILIVDDSTFIVEGLTALFRKSYRVLPCSGGDECISLLRTEKPDVIVLDILMEPMDGWETLARIKENPATQYIPVIMFSAKKISPEEAEAHRDWIDDFLIKPVNPRELLAAIEKILRHELQNKSVLYHWSKAGVPREKIDEYLMLSSNLEVDVSLLALMKKQVDHFVVPPARYEDLTSSVALLGGRVDAGRAAIDAFFRETGLVLPPETMVPETGEPAPGDPALHDVPDSVAVPAGTPEVIKSVSPLPVTPPASQSTGTADDIPTPLPNQPCAGSDAPDRKAEEPVDQPDVRTGDLPRAVDAPACSGGIPDASTIVPPAMVQESLELPPDEHGSMGCISIPSYAGPMTLQNSSGLDHLFEPESVPETPVAVNPVHRSHQPAAHSGSLDPVCENAPVQAAPRTGGFFSRIITVIMSLFGRVSK